MAKTQANRGKELERLIENALKRGDVYWQRNHPKTTYAKLGGRLQAFPSGNGPPDFLVGANGVWYLFEAKSFKGERWQFDGLAPHQAADLDLAEKHGLRTGVLLGQFAEDDKLVQAWWVDWRTLCPLWHRWHLGMAKHGQAGLRAEELSSLDEFAPPPLLGVLLSPPTVERHVNRRTPSA